MGIDGFTFMHRYPIQVKQSEGIGRNVVDNFKAIKIISEILREIAKMSTISMRGLDYFINTKCQELNKIITDNKKLGDDNNGL